MDKSRPALAQKPSRGNLPVPYVLIPLKSNVSAARVDAEAKTKPKPGPAGLRQHVQQLKALPAAVATSAGAKEVEKAQAPQPSATSGSVGVRRNAQRAAAAVVPPVEQQHARPAAAKDAPKPSRASPIPVPGPPPSRQRTVPPPPRIPSPELVVPPPAPNPESDSDLSYVTVDDDGVVLRPLPARPDAPLAQAQASLAPGPRRVVDVSPVVLPPAFRVDQARRPAPEPAYEGGDEDIFGASEEEEEEVDDAREEGFPSSGQQPRRRPYQARQPRNDAHLQLGHDIDYDVEMKSDDLLAAFLQADRALKQTRPHPQRRNLDDDDEAVPGPAPREEVAEQPNAIPSEAERSDEELPDISEVLARKALVGKGGASRAAGIDRKGKSKGKGKARRSPSNDQVSSAPPDAPAAKSARPTTSRGAKSKLPAPAVDSDDSLDLPPKPVAKAKKKVAVKGKGKKAKRGSDDDGPVDTEALLQMLPRRKRRVVLVASDSDAESEVQGTDYDEEAEIRKAAKTRKAVPAEVKKASSRAAKSAPKKTRKVVEESVDSEVDRRREKRVRRYKELDAFEMPTETVA